MSAIDTTRELYDQLQRLSNLEDNLHFIFDGAYSMMTVQINEDIRIQESAALGFFQTYSAQLNELNSIIEKTGNLISKQ